MRVAAAITRSELAKKIVAVTEQTVDELIDDSLDAYELCEHPSIKADLKKVEFSLENFSCQEAYGSGTGDIGKIIGLQYHWPLTFLGCSAGGDWESPIFFIVYWDGQNLRAYIPSEGNTWNKKTKSAYGNNEDGGKGPGYNANKLLADIEARVEVL